MINFNLGDQKMTENKHEYRRDHAIKGMVPEKPKMEKNNDKKRRITKNKYKLQQRYSF